LTSPMCKYGGQCDCKQIIKTNPCGTTITTNMGNTVVNEICAGTCGLCDDGRRLGGNGMGHPGHGKEGMKMGCNNLTCPSSVELLAANHMMHEGMSIKFSCDPAVDFVRGMIPHHAGAIAMCEVFYKSSVKDAYLIDLCDNITRVQRAEIAFLSEWLVARNQNISASCKVCEGGAILVQPGPICDDRLPSSSFCHVLGGDFFCTCNQTIAQHSCSSVVEIKGFGHLNVSAECMRSCGHCGTQRPPLFHSPCGVGNHKHGHGGSGNHGGSGKHGGHDGDQVQVSLAHHRLQMMLPLLGIVFCLASLAEMHAY